MSPFFLEMLICRGSPSPQPLCCTYWHLSQSLQLIYHDVRKTRSSQTSPLEGDHCIVSCLEGSNCVSIVRVA